jgi:flagellar motor switch protein FliG
MKPKAHGIRKAAVLVASLSRRAADRVLDQMDPQQAQAVRQMMVELGPIDPDEQRQVVEEFFRVRPMVPGKHPPGIELDGRLAERLSLGATRFSSDEAPPCDPTEGPPFRFLRRAEAEKLAGLLASERPQAIALVLSHLPPEQVGNVLARLAPALQVDVIRRLVDLEETDPDILRDVERALEARFSEQVLMQRRRMAGVSAVAGILKASQRQVGVQILNNLASHDRQLAERLSPERFEFDEIGQLDDVTLATILNAAEPDLIVLALVGETPERIQRVLQALPESEAELVRHELDHLSPTRLSDVEEAQRQIAALARRLAMEGRIELPRRQPAVNLGDENLRSLVS